MIEKKTTKNFIRQAIFDLTLETKVLIPRLSMNSCFAKSIKSLPFLLIQHQHERGINLIKKNNKKSHLTPSFVHGHYNIATLKKIYIQITIHII